MFWDHKRYAEGEMPLENLKILPHLTAVSLDSSTKKVDIILHSFEAKKYHQCVVKY